MDKNVVHIVIFKWKDGTSVELIESAKTALRGLASSVPGILGLEVGENFTDRGQGFTTGLVVRLESKAALEAYQPHPAHQAVVVEFIRPILADIIAVDFEA